VITLAIDNFTGRGRPLPNGVSPELCANDDFTMVSPFLDYPRIFYYLNESNIDVTVKHTDEAREGAWYPVTVSWFDFTLDYLELLNPLVFKNNLKIVFFYQEADNPQHIDKRIRELCDQHNYYNVAFVSGNSVADQYEYTWYWPEIEYMYQRTVDFSKASLTHFKRRSKHFMALCRIDKLWRKVFMANLWQQGLHNRGYFSYCQENLGEQDDWDGVDLYNEFLSEQNQICKDFIKAGPFFVDDLTSEQRNDYSVLMDDMYQDSYFSYVMETFIDVDNSGGQFITEKTLKPILHCQPFICLAEHNHLKHLRELGYHTFDNIFDESYDDIQDTTQRFKAVQWLSEDLARIDLDTAHDMYTRCGDRLMENRVLLENINGARLRKLATDLNAI